MNTDLFKLAPPLPVYLPDGSLLRLHPLPHARVERCWCDANLELRALGGEPDVAAQGLLAARKLLAAAAGRDLAEELLVPELLALWATWQRHQSACDPVLAGKEVHLMGHLRRRVNDDPDVMRDGAMAYLAGKPDAYYGRALVDLTDGQVSYWQALANAFEEFHVGDTKEPTKRWLNSDPREG